MLTSSVDAMYSSKTSQSMFTGGMIENCASSILFHANLSMSAIHHRCTRNLMEQITDHFHLQPTMTALEVGRWNMRTRLKKWQQGTMHTKEEVFYFCCCCCHKTRIQPANSDACLSGCNFHNDNQH